jgi:hypothetical protein
MKVFGVGLPRTGTRSLLAGLQTMGLRVVHAMHLKGCSYDDADAFADTPIWADWRLLANQYRDAKFILTIRDPAAWFESFVRALRDSYLYTVHQPETCTGRAAVDRRCYIKVFHGCPVAEADFRQVYIDHSEMVQTYFGGSDRLLVIDISKPGALATTSGFLGLKVMNFPNVNELSKVNR